MRWRAALGLAGLLLGVLGVDSVGNAAEPASPESRSATLEQLMPKWELGDRWIVETTSRPLQIRGDPSRATSRAIQWQFAVARFEKAIADDCFRIEIRCQETATGEPITVLWIDKRSRTLRQLQTQLPVPGGFQTVTQSFDFPSGQAGPVLGPFSALPVELPSFQAAQAKGAQLYSYTVHDAPQGAKALGDLGFACQVEQLVAPATAEQLRRLLPQEHAKAIQEQPMVAIELKAQDRTVLQLWQPAMPWPTVSDNGTTTCRLVKVLPKAGSSGNREGPSR